MVPYLLLVAGLVAASPEAAKPPADLAAYEAARAGVGRDADAHVRLALWCEARGLDAERLKHLAIAVMIDPAHATARGLLGLVAFRGRWQRPDAVGDTVKADADLSAALAEYNARRARLANTADAHWRLALWCEERGLGAEASAHLAAVVRLDPGREAAWRRLGCKKVGGRWVTAAQLAAEKEEAAAQKQADKEWRPRLARWRSALGDRARRPQAEEGLSGVTDPRAVPSVVAVFATDEPRSQAIAVRILGQIDSAGSSRALAMMSILSDSAEVRRTAAETLKRRDAREFAGLLVSLLRDPIEYEVRPVGGPGSPGALFVQGKRFNVQRLYAPPPVPDMPIAQFGTLGFDSDGFAVITLPEVTGESTRTTSSWAVRPGLHANFFPAPDMAAAVDRFRNSPETMREWLARRPRTRQILERDPSAADRLLYFGFTRKTTVRTTNRVQLPVGRVAAEYEKAAMVAQGQLADDVAAVDAYNESVAEANGRISRVLEGITGEDRGEDRKRWEEWWTNAKGYNYTSSPEPPVPTFVQDVPIAYRPQAVPVLATTRSEIIGTSTEVTVSSALESCFGAGTAVRTLRGSAPIESLRVGDQVLTQDLKTGALGFRPILVVHRNPPSKTYLIKLPGETIVSSAFHRFWKAGHGWVMAQNLGAGDTLRFLDGLASVESVEPGPVQPVFNLDVAVDHDFFAGDRGALVHDNTVPELRQAPFDAPAALASASR